MPFSPLWKQNFFRTWYLIQYLKKFSAPPLPPLQKKKEKYGILPQPAALSIKIAQVAVRLKYVE